jgi:hypothetical protein
LKVHRFGRFILSHERPKPGVGLTFAHERKPCVLPYSAPWCDAYSGKRDRFSVRNGGKHQCLAYVPCYTPGGRAGNDGDSDGEDTGLFRVSEKVRLVGVCLHVANDKEFAQVEINHPRCNHHTSQYLC